MSFEPPEPIFKQLMARSFCTRSTALLQVGSTKQSETHDVVGPAVYTGDDTAFPASHYNQTTHKSGLLSPGGKGGGVPR